MFNHVKTSYILIYPAVILSYVYGIAVLLITTLGAGEL